MPMNDEPREPIGLLAALGLGLAGGVGASVARRALFSRSGARPGSIPDLLTVLAGLPAGGLAHAMDTDRWHREFEEQYSREHPPRYQEQLRMMR